MNLSDYFEPVDFSRFKSGPNPLGKFSLGTAIEKSAGKFSGNLSSLDAALIGLPFEDGKKQKKDKSTPDKIRQALYRLAVPHDNLRIADFGNLKSATTQKGVFFALRDVVEYLREAEVTAIFMGAGQEFTTGICEAFKHDRFFWLTAIDAVADIKKGKERFSATNYLTRVFNNLPDLFHFSLLGYQNHLTESGLIAKTPGISEHLRLGQLRENFTQAEVLLRSTDVLTFDMGAVRYSDAPSTAQKNPNGLTGEEACHLARYAGLSQKTITFGLFGIKTGEEPDQQTTKLGAEVIWYFLEGLSQRPAISRKMVYKVELEELDHPIVFLHDQASNRWWFEAQSVSGERIEVPCAEEDYHQAAGNEIPGRWLQFVQKMDRILK